jgi:uncharacterized C2H2 Zn-finger protein
MSSKKKFPCDECPQVFNHASSLSRHRKKAHDFSKDATEQQLQEIQEDDEEVHVPKHHDRLVELMAETGFNEHTAKNLSKFCPDIVQDEEEEIYTVYEPNPNYDGQSYDADRDNSVRRDESFSHSTGHFYEPDPEEETENFYEKKYTPKTEIKISQTNNCSSLGCQKQNSDNSTVQFCIVKSDLVRAALTKKILEGRKRVRPDEILLEDDGIIPLRFIGIIVPKKEMASKASMDLFEDYYRIAREYAKTHYSIYDKTKNDLGLSSDDMEPIDPYLPTAEWYHHLAYLYDQGSVKEGLDEIRKIKAHNEEFQEEICQYYRIHRPNVPIPFDFADAALARIEQKEKEMTCLETATSSNSRTSSNSAKTERGLSSSLNLFPQVTVKSDGDDAADAGDAGDDKDYPGDDEIFSPGRKSAILSASPDKNLQTLSAKPDKNLEKIMQKEEPLTPLQRAENLARKVAGDDYLPLSYMIKPDSIGPAPKAEPVFYMSGNVPIRCIVHEDYFTALKEFYKSSKEAVITLKNTGTALDIVEADLRLVKKLYMSGKKKSELPFRVNDLSRLKLEYLDENKKWRVDQKGQNFIKIITCNIINALLRMNNNMIKSILKADNEEVRDALLDDCQIGSTQNHAHALLTPKWQIKLVKRIADFIHNLSEEEIVP